MRPRWRGCAPPARSFSARPISTSSPPGWSAFARLTASRRNLFDEKLIPGGSSTGSALSVGAGIAPLALGTDTAGSGRVPAAFANIVGLKPSLGLVSTAGVVPACRTLDCVSVFALTVDDAVAMLKVIAGPDDADPFSRARPLHAVGPMPNGVKLGVPLAAQRLFFGDKLAAAAYDAALERWAALGAKIVEVDMAPFYAAAKLLYEGPWLAERYLTVKDLLASSPDAIHPVTRQIIAAGETATAADAFSAFYKLAELRHACDRAFASIDALMLPTAPTIYTVADVLADPIALNSKLGTYTNFVNLLDLCGLALPASMRSDGLPFGITLLAPGGEDAMLASLGRQFHHSTGLPLGALKVAQPPLQNFRHRRGGRNRDRRGRRASVRHAAQWRIALGRGAAPRKRQDGPALPVLCARRDGATEARFAAREKRCRRRHRSRDMGAPETAFGRFVGAVPEPLSIGTLELNDGRGVKGFLVEAEATPARAIFPASAAGERLWRPDQCPAAASSTNITLQSLRSADRT